MLLTPQEWQVFAAEKDIEWEAVFRNSFSSGRKKLPGAGLRPDFDMRSRHATCPFEYRDVPCFIDKAGNPDLGNYVWVEVRSIRCEKTRKKWMQDFMEADGFDRPTYRIMREFFNETDEKN